MPERRVTIAAKTGLHARPAKLFVQAAAKAGVPVRIRVGDGKPVPANSMLGVLSLGATHGTEVVVSSEDQPTLDKIAEMVAADLDA